MRQRTRIGEKHGLLTVIKKVKEPVGKTGRKIISVIAECECGNTTKTSITKLRSGHTKSCGCYNIRRITKHGMAGTPTYTSWSGMLDRCNNKNNKRYYDYGGRGISVCKKWYAFENFFEDMGQRPFGTTLDRIDNNKGYSPGNCRWSTPTEQLNNTRKNRYLTFKDKSLTMRQWSKKLSIKYVTLSARIQRGWSVENALTKPIGNYRRNEKW